MEDQIVHAHRDRDRPAGAAAPSTVQQREQETSAPAPEQLQRLLGGTHHDPHSVLGAHAHPQGTVIRVLRPGADEVTVLTGGGEYPLTGTPEHLFHGVVPGPPGDYRLRVRYGDHTEVTDDPYRWLPTLGEVDLHLIGEGRHERLWEALGAQVRSYATPDGPVEGTSFAVWAPNARGVRVTGDFDGWSGVATPLRSLGSSGVWEIFLPGVGAGTRYKFRLLGPTGTGTRRRTRWRAPPRSRRTPRRWSPRRRATSGRTPTGSTGAPASSRCPSR
jgi:1,4-alpha-glucan branching enzyme